MKKLSVNQAAMVNGGSAALIAISVIGLVSSYGPYAWKLGQWIGSKIVGR